jgi:hypothetical protein
VPVLPVSPEDRSAEPDSCPEDALGTVTVLETVTVLGTVMVLV